MRRGKGKIRAGVDLKEEPVHLEDRVNPHASGLWASKHPGRRHACNPRHAIFRLIRMRTRTAEGRNAGCAQISPAGAVSISTRSMNSDRFTGARLKSAWRNACHG